MILSAHHDLAQIVDSFLRSELSVSDFVDAYQLAWKRWRDSRELDQLNKATASAFDRIFTACDCFNEGEPSASPTLDIDAAQLRAEILSYREIISQTPRAGLPP